MTATTTSYTIPEVELRPSLMDLKLRHYGTLAASNSPWLTDGCHIISANAVTSEARRNRALRMRGYGLEAVSDSRIAPAFDEIASQAKTTVKVDGWYRDEYGRRLAVCFTSEGVPHVFKADYIRRICSLTGAKVMRITAAGDGAFFKKGQPVAVVKRFVVPDKDKTAYVTNPA